MTVQTTAQFLDGLAGWQEASTLIITVWEARTFPGSYHDYEARSGEGATMWSVPSVKYDERSAADFVRDIAAGKAPGMEVTTSPSRRRFWGEDQISGGLGACTEIWITGGPWPGSKGEH